VLSAGQQTQADASGKAVNVPVVTLLVTPEQAEILTLAGNEGKLQLVLRNSGDLALGKAPGRQMSELYGQQPKVAAPPAPRRLMAAPPPAPPAPVPEPPLPEEVVVIRGTTRSVEKIGAGSGK
jgi:pilus assembly protein CpaB